MDEMAVAPTTLTKKLIWLCSQHELTQRDLAEIAGVSQGTVSNYLAGSTPSAAILLKISTALDIPLEWLINDEKEVHDFTSAIRESLARLPDATVIDYIAGLFAADCRLLEKHIEAVGRLPFEQIAQELQTLDDSGNLPDAEELPDHIAKALRVAHALIHLPVHTVDRFRAFDRHVERANRLLASHRSLLDKLGSTKASSSMMMMYLSGRVVSMEREDGLAEADEATADALAAFPAPSEPTPADALRSQIEGTGSVDPDTARAAGLGVNRARKSKR